MSRPSANSRLLIVIPAWNEEAVLGDVLESVKVEKPSFADILVVSDGSTDATAAIARAAGVAVLDLPLNLGVGGAMRAGFQYARRMGYGIAAFFNGFLSLVGNMFSGFFGFVPIAVGIVFCAGPSAGTS